MTQGSAPARHQVPPGPVRLLFRKAPANGLELPAQAMASKGEASPGSACCLSSDPTRDRPQLRRDVLAEIEEDFVDIAPAPALRRVVALDDRMAGGVIMGGCVPVGALVAAADMPATAAQAQVNPPVAGLQAVLAPARAGRHLADGVGVGAYGCVAHPAASVAGRMR